MHTSTTRVNTSSTRQPAGRRPILTALVAAAAFAAGVLIVSRLIATDWMLTPFLAFAAAAAVTIGFLHQSWTASRFGPANVLTLLRLALATLLLLPIVQPGLATGEPGWAILTLAVVTLALDGIDGPLARANGLAGTWGARFDMEVDSVFALLLSIAVWRIGVVGPWVILLGGLRYLFVLAALALPWLDAPLPARFRRKVVCVMQIATLVALIAPVTPPAWSGPAAFVMLALLTWSFAIDVIWLARQR